MSLWDNVMKAFWTMDKIKNNSDQCKRNSDYVDGFVDGAKVVIIVVVVVAAIFKSSE